VFFFQAEDGIRDFHVTGVQTCALPISSRAPTVRQRRLGVALRRLRENSGLSTDLVGRRLSWSASKVSRIETARIGVRESDVKRKIGRASCRERAKITAEDIPANKHKKQ